MTSEYDYTELISGAAAWWPVTGCSIRSADAVPTARPAEFEKESDIMNTNDLEIQEYYEERERKNIELIETCWWVIKKAYHVLALYAIYKLF